jgi:hypothetical protein
MLSRLNIIVRKLRHGAWSCHLALSRSHKARRASVDDARLQHRPPERHSPYVGRHDPPLKIGGQGSLTSEEVSAFVKLIRRAAMSFAVKAVAHIHGRHSINKLGFCSDTIILIAYSFKVTIELMLLRSSNTECA